MLRRKSEKNFDKILEPLIKRLVFKKTVTEADLNIVLEITIKELVGLIGAQSITLYLIGKDDKIHFSYVYFSEELYKDDKQLEEAYKKKSEDLKKIVLERGQGIVGKVIEDGTSYLCKDAQKDTNFYAKIDTLTGRKTQSLITVPLVADKKNIGAIQVIDKNGSKPFDEKDQSVLEDVANYSSKIIQKVHFPEIEFSEKELASYVAKLTKYPYVEIGDDFEVNKGLLKEIGSEILKKYAMLPIKKKGMSSLEVILDNPFNLQLIEEFEYTSKMKVKEISISSREDIIKAINKYLEEIGEGGTVISDVAAKVHEEYTQNIETIEIEDSKAVDEESAPIVQLASKIIEDAYGKGASDIHVEPFEKEILVRYRVDGVLYEEAKLSNKAINALVARLKIMSDLDITEKRIPQDGRIKFKNFTKKNIDIELRVSTAPLIFGEKIVMRLLDKSGTLLGLEAMGFSDSNLKVYRELIAQPYGMILHVGPTGSGKTTTLYAALNEINTPDVNIQTAEDPVEYMLKGINQMQMHKDVGLTFASALRCFLRQDPDIIMVGEIRDQETAAIGIEAALTGHLVVSTLHTNDAATTITRFIDMGIEPFLISSSVLGICAQRLVRKLCPECKEEHELPAEECERLGIKKGTKFYKAKGCPKCHDLGYKGRIGVHELLTMNEEIKQLITERKSSDVIEEAAIRNGLRTLYADGLAKAIAGITSLEEVFSNLRK